VGEVEVGQGERGTESHPRKVILLLLLLFYFIFFCQEDFFNKHLPFSIAEALSLRTLRQGLQVRRHYYYEFNDKMPILHIFCGKT